MSNFSEELEKQMATKPASQVEAAELSGISQSQISKWLRSEQTSISSDQITALAKALSDDPVKHANLVKAHLLDEKFGAGSELVRIEIDSPAEWKDKPRPRSKGERAMNYLAEQRVISRDVNDLVIDLAKCLGAEL